MHLIYSLELQKNPICDNSCTRERFLLYTRRALVVIAMKTWDLRAEAPSGRFL